MSIMSEIFRKFKEKTREKFIVKATCDFCFKYILKKFFSNVSVAFKIKSSNVQASVGVDYYSKFATRLIRKKNKFEY
jgi:hypothetical protein